MPDIGLDHSGPVSKSRRGGGRGCLSWAVGFFFLLMGIGVADQIAELGFSRSSFSQLSGLVSAPIGILIGWAVARRRAEPTRGWVIVLASAVVGCGVNLSLWIAFGPSPPVAFYVTASLITEASDGFASGLIYGLLAAAFVWGRGGS
jgi:hypothetical protein